MDNGEPAAACRGSHLKAEVAFQLIGAILAQDQRVAVVAGGSAGVGRAVVSRLREAGYRVGVLARGRERLDALGEIYGDRVYCLSCDVADAAAVARAGATIEEVVGGQAGGRYDRGRLNRAGAFGEGTGIDLILTGLAGQSRRCPSAANDHATVGVQGLAREVIAIIAGEKEVGGCDFPWLTGPAHGHMGTESRDVPGVE